VDRAGAGESVADGEDEVDDVITASLRAMEAKRATPLDSTVTWRICRGVMGSSRSMRR
jgi:hypothetical protein